ncbi:MAG: porin [Alphaproteobacteria bacterium]|nr:porin [Alphaproteobacteria bacterium]
MHVKWSRSTRPLSAVALTALVVAPSVMSDAMAQAVVTKEPFVLSISGSDNFAGQYAKENYPINREAEIEGENGTYAQPTPGNNQFYNLASLRFYVDGKSDVLDYGAQFWLNLAESKLTNDVAFGYIGKDELGRISFGRQNSLDWAGFDPSYTWGVTNNKFGDASSGRGFGPNHNWGQAAIGYGGINTRADAIAASLSGEVSSGASSATRITYVTPQFYGLQFAASYGIDSTASDVEASRNDYLVPNQYSANIANDKQLKGVKNPLELWVRYANKDIGSGFGLSVAAGYASGKPKRYDPTSFGLRNVSAFGARAGLSWGGLLTQFVYNNAGKSAEPTRGNENTVLNGQNQQGFSTSLAYNFSGNQIGAYFARGRASSGVDGVDPGGQSLGNDTVTSIGIGAHHYLADGVKLYLGVESVKADNQSVDSARNVDKSVNVYRNGSEVPRWNNKTAVVTLGSTIEF